MKHILKKQPSEVIPCTMDFLKALPAGESIGTYTVIVYDSANVDVSSDMLSGSATLVGSQVRATVKGGVSGAKYKITFTATTAPGLYVLEEDVELQVKEE